LLGEGTTTAQRVNLIRLTLDKKPESEPGTKFAYSNTGYAIAAAMGEKVTGKSWETLIQEELFDPLGMTSAGFGPPGTKGQVDQPWGHSPMLGKLAVPVQGDNPPSIGPAGRVHCTIRDWAKFISLHLRGARGEERTYLSPETFARLHRPPSGGDYADGWMVVQRPWGGGTVLSHSGSNTMWYCVVWMAPQRNFAVLSATNVGGEAAAKACDDASGAMIRRYMTMRAPGAGASTLPTTRRAR
jgi:CubicO group peptidase (beta-lactamase class C family)